MISHVTGLYIRNHPIRPLLVSHVSTSPMTAMKVDVYMHHPGTGTGSIPWYGSTT